MAQAERRSPLHDYQCFETRDVDEARAIVARHFYSHRLERLSVRDRFDARQNRAPGRCLSLNYIRYGADVAIDPGELSDFYLLQIPVNGTAQIDHGTCTIHSCPRVGTVLNPDRDTRMRWREGCEQILLQIDKTYLHAIATQMTGVEIGQVHFTAALDMARPGVSAWACTLRGLFGAAEHRQAFCGPGDIRQRQLEEGLVMSLLEAQPNTVSALLRERRSAAAPGLVRRALQLIHERFEEDLSLLDISVYAGTTPRNLQILFKRELGCSPMEKLQSLRLNYAHYLLLSAGAHRSIAEVAERSGHRHAGRFSVAYKARFGEAPRETRNRVPFG